MERKTFAVRSEFQTTNIFTKALGANHFKFLGGKLDVCGIHSPT